MERLADAKGGEGDGGFEDVDSGEDGEEVGVDEGGVDRWEGGSGEREVEEGGGGEGLGVDGCVECALGVGGEGVAWRAGGEVRVRVVAAEGLVVLAEEGEVGGGEGGEVHAELGDM